MDHFFTLALGGLVAGAMNALAGGGSFVSLLAMIAAGIPSVQANASGTVALFPGQVTSAWTYWDGMRPVCGVPGEHLLAVSIVGGLIGSLLLLSTHRARSTSFCRGSCLPQLWRSPSAGKRGFSCADMCISGRVCCSPASSFSACMVAITAARSA